MSKALKSGKKVEFPFGQLKKVRADKSLNVSLWGEWPRELFTVELVPDEAGYSLLNGPEDADLGIGQG
jgi:hypothetical protein